MFRKNRVAFILAVFGIISLVFFLTNDISKAEKEKKFYKFDDKNQLLTPEGYREWIFVGTPLTPNDLNDGKAPFPEFHNVYIDPVSYKHYKETGKFRDGTILVKELVSVGAKVASSGNGYFEGDYIGLEATIKDSKRFAKEPGTWAYFSFTNTDHSLPYKKTATAFPAAACNACHQGTAADDWVFTQFYPVLRAAKPAK
ncbi:MAG: cytochrome P460 family protein [Thermodesulfobacteriota bacterium]